MWVLLALFVVLLLAYWSSSMILFCFVLFNTGSYYVALAGLQLPSFELTEISSSALLAGLKACTITPSLLVCLWTHLLVFFTQQYHADYWCPQELLITAGPSYAPCLLLWSAPSFTSALLQLCPSLPNHTSLGTKVPGFPLGIMLQDFFSRRANVWSFSSHHIHVSHSLANSTSARQPWGFLLSESPYWGALTCHFLPSVICSILSSAARTRAASVLSSWNPMDAVLSAFFSP